MSSFKTLLIKELRQNSFIYAIPFLFILGALIYGVINPKWLTVDLGQIIALVVPLALACSYGLQAFDLEENGQTRDFLITRPVSIETILWTKFSGGLLVLLPLTVLWSFAFFPQQVRLPFPLTDFRNIWFTAFLTLVFIVYLASLAAGVWVKGPKKLLAGAAISVSISFIFFFGWFEAMTYIYLNTKFSNSTAQIEAGLAMIIVTAGLLFLLLLLFRHGVIASLRNEFSQSLRKNILIALSLFILLPITIGLINRLDRPAIQPFHSLYTTLFNRENWFVGSQSQRQYNGDLYAFVDRNWLGIGRINQKARIIYKAPLKSTIFNPIWSPDGARIAIIVDQKVVIVDALKRKLLQTLNLSADQIAWSSDGRQLLIAKKIKSRELGSTTRKIIVNSFLVSQIDLTTNSIQKQRNISFPGTSFAWDSSGDQIIGLEAYSWTMGTIHLGTNQTKLFQVPPRSNEQVVYSRIIPLSANFRIFRIIILTFDIQNKRRIYLYKYDNTAGKLTLQAVLKNHPLYRDLVSGDRSNRLLVSTVDGVYRLISLPKGVDQGAPST
jgi:hypothetical protein